MLIDPIFDRTALDVEFARAHRNDPEHYKGALNYVDWQRITHNINYVFDTLTEYGYSPLPLTSETSWALGEIPPREEIAKIRTDVSNLREFWYVFMSTPLTPELPLTHFEKINDIERILFDLSQILDWLINTLLYSNAFYSDESFDPAVTAGIHHVDPKTVTLKSGAWNAMAGAAFYFKEI